MLSASGFKGANDISNFSCSWRLTKDALGAWNGGCVCIHREYTARRSYNWKMGLGRSQILREETARAAEIQASGQQTGKTLPETSSDPSSSQKRKRKFPPWKGKWCRFLSPLLFSLPSSSPSLPHSITLSLVAQTQAPPVILGGPTIIWKANAGTSLNRHERCVGASIIFFPWIFLCHFFFGSLACLD